MTTILSIQSSVAYGHVGNSAAVFPLQRLGVEVWPVHTVHFSNHTGYGAWRGPLMPPDDVREVVTGIEERGALPEVDAVLSGYQGGEQIGEVILDAVARTKAANPAAIYACDPVMGNAASGCFVHPAIPVLLRERVVPAGRPDHPQPVRARLPHRDRPRRPRLHPRLRRASPRHGPGTVLVTSVLRPDRPEGTIEMLAVHGDGAWIVQTPAAADEGQRLRRRHRRPVHRPPARRPGMPASPSGAPSRASSTCSRRTHESGPPRAAARAEPGRDRRPADAVRGPADPLSPASTGTFTFAREPNGEPEGSRIGRESWGARVRAPRGRRGG